MLDAERVNAVATAVTQGEALELPAPVAGRDSGLFERGKEQGISRVGAVVLDIVQGRQASMALRGKSRDRFTLLNRSSGAPAMILPSLYTAAEELISPWLSPMITILP